MGAAVAAEMVAVQQWTNGHRVLHIPVAGAHIQPVEQHACNVQLDKQAKTLV